jgi:hypothetical protein
MFTTRYFTFFLGVKRRGIRSEEELGKEKDFELRNSRFWRTLGDL